MKKANNLLEKVKKLIDNNEYNTVKLNGISCSRSDLEALAMVLKHYITYGNFGEYMLIGNIEKILLKNNLL